MSHKKAFDPPIQNIDKEQAETNTANDTIQHANCKSKGGKSNSRHHRLEGS